jgi:hypothetical protein
VFEVEGNFLEIFFFVHYIRLQIKNREKIQIRLETELYLNPPGQIFPFRRDLKGFHSFNFTCSPGLQVFLQRSIQSYFFKCNLLST